MNLLEKLTGKEKKEEERYKEIEKTVDQLAYKWSLPQTTIRSIILTWMEFQKEYLK